MTNKKINNHRYLVATIALPIIAIICSFITFYAANICVNMIMEIKSPNYLLTTFIFLAEITFTVELIIAFMFIIRYALNPNVLKRMLKVYIIIFLSLSSLGAICTILSGVLKYGSLIKPYPYPGAHIIALVFHLLIVIGAILYLTWLKKFVPNDKDVFKTSHLYRFKTAIFGLLLLFTFNRCGAALWFPFYTTWSIFPRLIPFYIYLWLPIWVLIQGLIYRFNVYKLKRNVCLIITGALLFLSICLMFSIIRNEMIDPAYIAAISMAMPIERAAAMPIDTIMMAIIVPLSLIILFIEQSINFSKMISTLKMKDAIIRTNKKK